MKVLIGIDESPCSAMAMESVVKRHWPVDCEFKLLNVFEPLANQCVGFYAAHVPPVLIETEQQLLRARQESMKDKVSCLKKELSTDNVTGEVIEGYAWREIVDEADQWGADLIIVGSHGRSGLTKFLLGSVAEGVVSHAKCSVEVIKGHAPVESKVAKAG